MKYFSFYAPSIQARLTRRQCDCTASIQAHRKKVKDCRTVEFYLLVLLEQLVGELCEYLQEGDVGWRPGWIQWILKRCSGYEDPLPVQARHRLAILQRVQPEGEGEALGKLLNI
jgi:hypothetical protein